MRDNTETAIELTFRKDFTDAEWKTRIRHIATLKNFSGASVAAAKALAEIRDKKLYRPHKTLKDFCRAECGFTEKRLYQIIDFAKVRAALPAKSLPLVDTERKARELSRAPESKRAEVLKEAGKNGEITARTIRQAVATVIEEPLDASGKPVPAMARKYWDRREEAKDVMSALRYAKRAVNDLDNNDVMWVEVNLNGVLSDLGAAINRFGSALPDYVCPYCKGQEALDREHCRTCKGRGCISKFMWDHAVPEEMKK